MTSACLHYTVVQILTQQGLKQVSLKDRQQLAAVIHLCGVSKGVRFARRGFDFKQVATCGSHSTSRYYQRIQRAMDRVSSFPGRFWEQFF